MPEASSDPEATRELPKGHAVGDRFVVEHLVARGGMGEVYAACDRQSGERVALKVMQYRVDRAHALDRFEAESQLLARLIHPAIVRYVAHGVSGGAPYLAMEWLAGESLADRLRRGPLALEEALAITTRLAEALAFAHALGVVHRDVKPANVIVDGEGGSMGARLLDFGIARGGHARRFVTGTGAIIGTPGYMAPEQARGAPGLDARVDIFALGCVLFECLAGFAAFRGATPLALLGKLLLEEAPSLTQAAQGTPPAIADLVARMLAKESALRPRDGTALLHELEGLSEGASLRPVSEAPPERLTHREQRFVSVIVAGEVSLSSVESDPGLAATLSTGDLHHRQELKQAIAPFGARIEWTSRGGLLVLLGGSEGAKEQTFFAARCALAMRGVLPQTPLALVAGRGEVGAARVVGEVIDRAVGLLAAAPTASRGAPPIVLDEVTATLLGDRFVVAPHAQGRALIGEAALDAIGTPRTLLGRPAPFVGRDRELAMLRALYDEVAEERVARAALVVAPAGVGKTRLLQELVREIQRRDRPPELWLARADPLAVSSTFSLVGQALRRAASLFAHESTERARQKLLFRTQRHLPPADAWRVAALLGEAIGVPFLADDDSPLLSAARQDRHLLAEQVQNAWIDFVRAETTRSPFVLLLEDVHWADPTSLRLVDLALGVLGERPLLVLASARPEIRASSPELWASRGLQELRLPELTRRASEKMVESTLGTSIAPEATARLVEHAAGNAFFLEELIRAAAEGRTDGLPDSVLSVVQLRLEALPPEARQTLRAASVFGESFLREGLERLLNHSGLGAIEASISLLVERELLVRRSEQAEYAFRHALVREAAYAMLTDDDRRLGHRLAAEWLEATGTGEPIVLAEHFERGGEPACAVSWYLKGSQRACWNDLRAVLHAASRGVACNASGEVLGELRLNEADALHLLGDLAEAKPCIEAAVELFPLGSTLWCASKGHLLQILVQLGHFESAASHANELLATEPEPAAYDEYVRAMLINAQAHCYSGLPRTAKRFLTRHDEIRCLNDHAPADQQALRERDVFLARKNVHSRDVVAAHLFDGDPWRAAAAAATSLAYHAEMGSQTTSTMLMTCEFAWSAFLTGNLEQAITWLEPALKNVRARHLDTLATLLASLRALALIRLGRAAEVRPELEGLRAASHSIKNGTIGLSALTHLAQTELALREHEGAQATARRVLALAHGAQFCSPALAVLARVALAAGAHDEALAAAREAVERWQNEGAAGYEEPLLWGALYDALVASGRPADARTLAREAAARCRAVASLAPDEAAAHAYLAGPDVAHLLSAAT